MFLFLCVLYENQGPDGTNCKKFRWWGAPLAVSCVESMACACQSCFFRQCSQAWPDNYSKNRRPQNWCQAFLWKPGRLPGFGANRTGKGDLCSFSSLFKSFLHSSRYVGSFRFHRFHNVKSTSWDCEEKLEKAVSRVLKQSEARSSESRQNCHELHSFLLSCLDFHWLSQPAADLRRLDLRRNPCKMGIWRSQKQNLLHCTFYCFSGCWPLFFVISWWYLLCHFAL